MHLWMEQQETQRGDDGYESTKLDCAALRAPRGVARRRTSCAAPRGAARTNGYESEWVRY